MPQPFFWKDDRSEDAPDWQPPFPHRPGGWPRQGPGTDWGPFRDRSAGWHTKRRALFFRFAGFAALMWLLSLAGVAGLAFWLARLLGGSGQAGWLAWPLGCGLGLILVLAAVGFTLRFWGRTVNPLARVMAAADAVADGDLSVRVPEGGPGEVGRLANSFNRMVEELERTDRQRRNLTADVAHELRTPLHIIQGNLEGILDGVYEAGPEQIELLLDETRQLSRLVEDLRTLSLAEGGQLPLKQEMVDVRELLSDVATSFSGQAEAAGVDLRMEEDGASSQPLSVTGDAGRLDQVLSNLVANALRHSSAGGAVVLRAEALPGGVRIQVADNGSGIPSEDLPFIFDRFWRGDRSRQRGGAATSGLGLAISRQLVQAHGGRIEVESQPGQGTTFTIDLPADGSGAQPQ